LDRRLGGPQSRFGKGGEEKKSLPLLRTEFHQHSYNVRTVSSMFRFLIAEGMILQRQFCRALKGRNIVFGIFMRKSVTAYRGDCNSTNKSKNLMIFSLFETTMILVVLFLHHFKQLIGEK
jgi:hypothetical protein